MQLNPFPASILREPAADAVCTCEHWLYCACVCHGVHCDPGEASCDMAYLPDDGGLTPIGCADCTPGRGAPHYLGCQLIGWHVVVPAVHRLS
jgi:hypothetical protein